MVSEVALIQSQDDDTAGIDNLNNFNNLKNCFDANLNTKCMSGSSGKKEYNRAFALKLKTPSEDIDLEIKSVSIYSPSTDDRYHSPKHGYKVGTIEQGIKW